MIAFRRATTADVPLLRDLAERIWRAYYPVIIGAEQVEYMLARMYSAETILREMNDGVVWELATLDAETIGFLSVTPDAHAKLNKLYLLPELHGRGLGAAMIEHACVVATEHGATELWLQVNKRNERALRAYERAGFRRVKEAVFDIGGEFVMDDYVLARTL
ncbi:MAG: GNAT family N-acetyltransferase [Chthoniobacteraceae bacterium]